MEQRETGLDPMLALDLFLDDIQEEIAADAMVRAHEGANIVGNDMALSKNTSSARRQASARRA